VRVGVERDGHRAVPERSDTIFTCTPACSDKVACVCLRSCNRMIGSYASRTNFVNVLDTMFG
jgi:hypothetical protein